MTSTLHKRPDATAYAIEDLVPLARRGTFRLPPLQRLFKWQSIHVRDLFDSIYRGFPVGTLLLWKKEAEAGHFQLGPAESPLFIDAGAQSDALWIVDGQQRISSLVGVLSPPAAPAGVFDLSFDLAWEDLPEDGEERPKTPFASAARSDPRRQPPPLWLPMRVVLDSEQLDTWLDESGVRQANPEYVRRARRLNKLVREYKIPAYVVETDDEETLGVIFERINNAGIKLERPEVFNALFRSSGKGTSLLEMAKRLCALGFGALDQDLLLKVVLATHDKDITNLSSDQFHEIRDIEVAETALQRAINFLRKDADIPHVALLPYSFPVIALSQFFRHHPAPRPRSRSLLARWVWMGAITGEHRAERIPAVRAILRDLKINADDEEGAVQALFHSVHGDRPEPELHSFRFGTAEATLELLALCSLGPCNLVDDDPSDAGPLFWRHHAPPIDVGPLLAEHGRRAVLALSTGEDDAPPAQARTLASLVIHPPLSRQALMGALLSATPEVLMSHGIDAEAGDALRAHDYPRMIALRGRRLRGHLASFLDAHARWGEADRPTLSSLAARAGEERDG